MAKKKKKKPPRAADPSRYATASVPKKPPPPSQEADAPPLPAVAAAPGPCREPAVATTAPEPAAAATAGGNSGGSGSAVGSSGGRCDRASTAAEPTAAAALAAGVGVEPCVEPAVEPGSGGDPGGSSDDWETQDWDVPEPPPPLPAAACAAPTSSAGAHKSAAVMPPGGRAVKGRGTSRYGKAETDYQLGSGRSLAGHIADTRICCPLPPARSLWQRLFQQGRGWQPSAELTPGVDHGQVWRCIGRTQPSRPAELRRGWTRLSRPCRPFQIRPRGDLLTHVCLLTCGAACAMCWLKGVTQRGD